MQNFLNDLLLNTFLFLLEKTLQVQNIIEELKQRKAEKLAMEEKEKAEKEKAMQEKEKAEKEKARCGDCQKEMLKKNLPRHIAEKHLGVKRNKKSPAKSPISD